MKRNFLIICLFLATVFVLNSCKKEDELEQTIYHNGTIEANEIWLAKDIHIVDDDVTILGCTVTIQPGTTILMDKGVSITVSSSGSYATLIAKGTVDSLITFKSSSVSPQKGDWDWIMFKSGAVDCILEYCDIKDGGGNSSWGMIDVEGNALISVKNCILSNFDNFGVEAEDDNGFVEFTNNTLTKTNGNIMNILGKHIHTIGKGNIFNVDANSGIVVTGSNSSYNYITESVTWFKQNCPYIIEDEVQIKNNATLSIEAGCVLKFLDDVKFQVGSSDEYAKLLAVGSTENPIIFTSASPSPQKGDWAGIKFTEFTLSGSILQNCKISYAGSSSSNNGNIIVEPCGGGNPTISNCEISNSNYYGIYLKEKSSVLATPTLSNNIFVNNTLGDIGQDD